MFKLSAIVLLAFAVYYTQSLPAQTSESETKTKTGENLRLYVNNGTEGVNYHLTPEYPDLEAEDKEIDAVMYAVQPFLNFMFDPDKGADELDDCLDQLEVQLVRDN